MASIVKTKIKWLHKTFDKLQITTTSHLLYKSPSQKQAKHSFGMMNAPMLSAFVAFVDKLVIILSLIGRVTAD